jgi:hypothetical protein
LAAAVPLYPNPAIRRCFATLMVLPMLPGDLASAAPGD